MAASKSKKATKKEVSKKAASSLPRKKKPKKTPCTGSVVRLGTDPCGNTTGDFILICHNGVMGALAKPTQDATLTYDKESDTIYWSLV